MTTASPPRLIAITDAGVRPWPALVEAARRALEAGLPALMLRDLTLTDDELMPFARVLREATFRCGAVLLVSRRVELARALAADGIHLGRGARPPREVARALGLRLAGYSAHTGDEVSAALGLGADYVFLSPVFATASKPGVAPLGLRDLQTTARRHQGRVIALGGIDASNLRQVVACGAHGAAVIRGIFGADDPGEATRALLHALSAV